MAKSTIELNFMQKNDFDLGETRFFTDTVDLPEDFSQPENMFFVGQLDLGLLARYDEDGMLPKDGYLYIYIVMILARKKTVIFRVNYTILRLKRLLVKK